MNKNKIVEFKTKDKEGLFVSIPYSYRDFAITQYCQEGTYLMETDSTGLNNWKINLPKGNYEFIGRSNELNAELVERKIGVPFKDYINILNEKDITVNYSDNSNFWAVLLTVR